MRKVELVIAVRNTGAGAWSAVKRSMAGVKTIGQKAAGAIKNAFTGALNAIRRGVGALRNPFVALAGVAGVGALINKAHELKIGWAEVSTLIDGTTDDLQRGVSELSKQTGVLQDELVKGVYQALSAGVPQDNVIEFLGVAAKAAIGGVATVSEAVDGLTNITNAWGMSSSEASKAADAMFAAVKGGKTTFRELATFMSQASSISASSGVGFTEVLGAVEGLTKSGTKTAVAFTQIRAAVIGLNSALGAGWSESMGFAQALSAVYGSAGGDPNKLQKLVGSVEAVQAILGLAGKNASKMSEAMTRQAGAEGAALEAFGKMDAARDIEKNMAKLQDVVLRLGAALETALVPVMTRTLEMFEGMGSVIGEALRRVWDLSEGMRGIARTMADSFSGGRLVADLQELFSAIGEDLSNAIVNGFRRGIPAARNAVADAVWESDLMEPLKGQRPTGTGWSGRWDESAGQQPTDNAARALQRIRERNAARNAPDSAAAGGGYTFATPAVSATAYADSVRAGRIRAGLMRRGMTAQDVNPRALGAREHLFAGMQATMGRMQAAGLSPDDPRVKKTNEAMQAMAADIRALRLALAEGAGR